MDPEQVKRELEETYHTQRALPYTVLRNNPELPPDAYKLAQAALEFGYTAGQKQVIDTYSGQGSVTPLSDFFRLASILAKLASGQDVERQKLRPESPFCPNGHITLPFGDCPFCPKK
ncbi:hypothetical protein C4580_00485 [Candidatus Woesearchaeota archaeon]|nr:MAG: hypothetical protein C4580_00485 [Candidatus Woesearchaeota archaeon]